MADATEIPAAARERLRRGRDRLEEIAPKRRECYEFWRGNQYVHLSDDNIIVAQPTTISVTGRSKPRHRVRTTRNLLVDIVAHEVSAATQRVPSYEVAASTTDPEDVAAARLAQKVALYGHDKWQLRQRTVEAVTHAVIADEAFGWPYFDATKGPVIADGVCEGEVAVRVYSGNECFWEPGCQFDDSPWHAVEHARPLQACYDLPKYIGGALKADASTSRAAGEAAKRQAAKMVMVCEYLERPSAASPGGLHLTIANDRVICPPCAYPHPGGRDRPVLHRLSYISDPDSDRDQGLVRHALDAQRTYNDCNNKLLEWKNLALNPQMFILNGRLASPRTDEPGAVFRVLGNSPPQWAPVPPVPRELFEIAQRAENDIAKVAAQNDIPAQVDSGKGVQAIIERDASRRQSFIAGLAQWHADIMRGCLQLVQRHYTERRLLALRGRFGPETIDGFLGADLRDQVDVRVAAASITPRTRESVNEQVLAFADRGWVSPQAAMAAMNGGTAEKLVEDYELDVAWQNHEIQLLSRYPEATNGKVPEARPFDNHPVHLEVLHSWMKTSDFALAEEPAREAARLHEQQHQSLLARQQADELEAQAARAEQAGMRNAARPRGAKPMPDRPKPAPGRTPA